MAETTIEWTRGPNGEKGFTFNPWIGCTKVSPACDNCYAEVSMPAKMQRVAWGQNAERHRTSKSNWLQPLRWNAEAERTGIRQRVFCASLADVFDNAVPVAWRRDLFNLILSTPHLGWLLLTKRIGNAQRMIDDVLPESMKALPADCPVAWPWPNVWIGATICNQDEADRDIPKLLQVPAAKRFLSMEPLLGPVDITPWLNAHEHNSGGLTDEAGLEAALSRHVDWVIVGGESGPNARPMHPEWARSLRDQCKAAGVPFFFKQWGEWAPDEHFTRLPTKDADIHEWGEGLEITGRSWRYGKKSAGRLLDGREWNWVPEGSTS